MGVADNGGADNGYGGPTVIGFVCDYGGEFFIIIINIIQHVSPCCYLTTFGILTAREIKVSPSCYFATFEIITGRARVSCLPSLNNRRFWGNITVFGSRDESTGGDDGVKIRPLDPQTACCPGPRWGLRPQTPAVALSAALRAASVAEWDSLGGASRRLVRWSGSLHSPITPSRI